jgi:hypothetical protein
MTDNPIIQIYIDKDDNIYFRDVKIINVQGDGALLDIDPKSILPEGQMQHQLFTKDLLKLYGGTTVIQNRIFCYKSDKIEALCILLQARIAVIAELNAKLRQESDVVNTISQLILIGKSEITSENIIKPDSAKKQSYLRENELDLSARPYGCLKQSLSTAENSGFIRNRLTDFLSAGLFTFSKICGIMTLLSVERCYAHDATRFN